MLKTITAIVLVIAGAFVAGAVDTQMQDTPTAACASVTSAPWTTVVDGTTYVCVVGGGAVRVA